VPTGSFITSHCGLTLTVNYNAITQLELKCDYVMVIVSGPKLQL